MSTVENPVHINCTSLIVTLQLFLHDAQKIWNKMKDLNETHEDAYYMTHDGMSVVHE